MALTPQQERFALEYLVDLNAKQAAIRAGYGRKTAAQAGSRLLKHAGVAAAIDTAMRARGERTKATADEVLREITRMALFDPAQLTGVRNAKAINKLPEDVRRAIVGWGYDRQGRFTIKLAKEGALEMLGRHHGLFRDKVEHSGNVTIQASGHDERL